MFPQYAAGLPGFNHRHMIPPNGFLGKQHFTLLASHCLDIDVEQDACPGVTLHVASSPDTEELFPHQWEMVYQVNLMDQDDPPADRDEDRTTSAQLEADYARAAESASPAKGPGRVRSTADDAAGHLPICSGCGDIFRATPCHSVCRCLWLPMLL